MLVGATWVVVEMVNTAAAVAHNGVLRSKEDTIDYMSNPNFAEIYNATHRWQVVKPNSSQEIQGRISDTDVDFKLMGYNLIDIDVAANIDVIVHKADDTIRTTLLTNVVDTAQITGSSWQTSTITFAFPGYTVVDATDYLEIDLYAEATSNNSGEAVSVDFRIDDPALPVADQMRLAEVAS